MNADGTERMVASPPTTDTVSGGKINLLTVALGVPSVSAATIVPPDNPVIDLFLTSTSPPSGGFRIPSTQRLPRLSIATRTGSRTLGTTPFSRRKPYEGSELP